MIARGTIRVVVILVLALAIGNVAILSLSFWARHATDTPRLDVAGVDNGVVVDARVWRGGAPTADGYRALADEGVTTVVDLRSDSERGVAAAEVLRELPVDLVRIPIRDGQLPTEEDVQTFLAAVAGADGTVFLHCGAGVGRTGAMVAAYQTATGATGGLGAARRNLAIGPPSLEQIAFAARGDRPGVIVTALSRVLDSPRRIWHSLG